MRTKGAIALERPLNLPLTFYPSFMLPYLEELGSSTWKVLAGRFSGALLRVTGRRLEFRGLPYHAALYISGAWIDPFRIASRLPPSTRSRVWCLVEAYAGLGLAINPYDKGLIFISVFLSRSTDFHRNTVRWCRKIIALSKSLEDIEASITNMLGTSYQLKQLPQALTLYLSRVAPLEETNNAGLSDLKKALLNLRNVGVKTALAYLLFTRPEASCLAPHDVHFDSMIRKLGLLDKNFAKPVKSYCKQYACSSCPIKGKCATALAAQEYGMLAGWLQTICYVHDKLYCKKKKCNTCPVGGYCVSKH